MGLESRGLSIRFARRWRFIPLFCDSHINDCILIKSVKVSIWHQPRWIQMSFTWYGVSMLGLFVISLLITDTSLTRLAF